MKIGIVLGSVRDGRAGESVAQWVIDQAAKRDDATFELIDVRSFDLPIVDDAQVPASRGGKYPGENVQAFADRMAAQNGFIFVTAEYNHGVPGAFKNAIDHLGPELNTKPVAFVSYGAESGVRAVEQWRPIVANFNMFDIRAQVPLNLFTEFDENGVKPNERRPDELTALFDSLIPIARKLAS